MAKLGLRLPFHPDADAANVWGPTSGQQADTDELHGWGCTSCRPCTANIHALAQSGIRRATFWELPTLVLADRWVSPFGLRLMARQCGKMIEAPDVCPMRCAPILAGTGGAYLPPAHQSLVLAPNGWVDDRDGEVGAGAATRPRHGRGIEYMGERYRAAGQTPRF